MTDASVSSAGNLTDDPQVRNFWWRGAELLALAGGEPV
jgi:hypothetical protein